MRKSLLLFIILTLCGCRGLDRQPLSLLQYAKRPISYMGMVLGTIESPLTLSLSQAPLPTPYTRLNKPLNRDVREAMARIDEFWARENLALTTGTLTQSLQLRERVWAQAGAALNEHRETYDTFADLAGEKPLVLVALSGGGLRATRLAAHALRELESAYGEIALDYLERPDPMQNQISAFASVSGGSIYSALVARQYADVLTSPLPQVITDPIEFGIDQLPFLQFDRRDDRTYKFFNDLEQSPTALWRTRSLGDYACFTYLTPFTIPLYFLTDYGYTHHLAITLDMYPDLLPLTFTFGDLPRNAPRFFFCATDMESGAPFVFTKSLLHLPSDRVLEVPTAQEDLLLQGYGPAKEQQRLHPLFNALTLEDVNSSPSRFPISMAAMTSAAFPGLLEPVTLCTYGYDEKKKQVYRTKPDLRLFDGGVYDNSGMMVLADMIEYLAMEDPPSTLAPRKPKPVMLLSVNAEITRFDPNLFKRLVWGKDQPKKVNSDLFTLSSIWPFSALSHGITAINQVHFLNKRRAEELAVGRLRTLERKGLIKFYYFPVNLTEIESGGDAQTEVTFEKLQSISTSLDLRTDEDDLLKKAASTLLQRQRDGYEPLDIAPAGGQRRLNAAEAWAMALIRSQLNLWEGVPRQRLDRPVE